MPVNIIPDYNDWQQKIVNNNLILDSLAEGVVVVDRQNLISFANESAVKMLGRSRTDLLKQRYEPVMFGVEAKDLPPPEAGEDVVYTCPVQFAMIEGETTHVNSETFHRRDGSTFLVEYVCIPLLEADQIIGVVVTFQDITERRDLEQAVRKARDAALEAAQEKADFLSNMSHEIRTPLNGIIGITDFLNNTDLSGEQRAYVQTLKTSADSLLQIVNDILDFSKMEAGKLRIDEVDFNIEALVTETIRLFTPEAKRKGITIGVRVTPSNPEPVNGDAVRVRQILQNLIGNAIKFTDSGSVDVEVKRESAGLWRFEVADTGIGIPDSKLATIFEPFSQADASTTRLFGGTGLGLAICRRLTQLMNGDIGVESVAGSGSKFWFTVKLTDAAEMKEAISKPSISLDTVRDPANLRVLVVDDNPVNQEVAVGRLRHLGFIPEVASNGLDAVELVLKEPFDLVLMDCRMPVMDGFEATRMIRDGGNRTTKIIAMTASVTAGIREECLQAGMDGYLSKPVSVEELQKVLQSHLNLKTELIASGEAVAGWHPFHGIIEEKTLHRFIEIEINGETTFTADLMSIFIEHTEANLTELQSAVFAKNLEIVKNKAHSLKGSSGNIGVINLFERFHRLEQEVDEDNWLRTEQTIEIIFQEFRRLKGKVANLSELKE